jgi:hypothetical protein
MLATPNERGRYILDAIREEAMRMEQAGHGLDYICRLSDRQFDEVQAELVELGFSLWHFPKGESVRAAACVVGRVYGVCLVDGGDECEGVELTPRPRVIEWRSEGC